MLFEAKQDDNLLRLAAFDRRKRHYRLHRSGMAVDEIARKTGCDERQVALDICWVADNGGFDGCGLTRRNRSTVLLENWAEFEATKGEAWEARHDRKLAQRMQRVRRSESDGVVTIETVTETRTSPGDPRFLSLVTDTAYKMLVLAGFVSDGQGGRAAVGAADESDGEDDTVAIVEVGDRQQAAAVAGKRFCRLGVVEGVVVGRDESGEAVTVEAADGGESGG